MCVVDFNKANTCWHLLKHYFQWTDNRFEWLQKKILTVSKFGLFKLDIIWIFKMIIYFITLKKVKLYLLLINIQFLNVSTSWIFFIKILYLGISIFIESKIFHHHFRKNFLISVLNSNKYFFAYKLVAGFIRLRLEIHFYVVLCK